MYSTFSETENPPSGIQGEPALWSLAWFLGRLKDLLTIGHGYPALFVMGDIPGFFLIFFNNFLNLSVTYNLFVFVGKFSPEFVRERVLPGAGFSVFLGSVYYWYQARRLAKAERRDDVTAQPFGISTPSMFAFVSFILLPAVSTLGTDQAYSLTIFSNFWSGVMEAGTAIYGKYVDRFVPRSALLSALAGIAVALIATGSLYQVAQVPAVAMVPFFLFLFFMASKIELKKEIMGRTVMIPTLMVVIAVGIAFAWIVYAIQPNYMPFPKDSGAGFSLPHFAFSRLRDGFQHGAAYVSVFLPLALINGIGSLQCIASAKHVNDRFDIRWSLAANGLATVISSILGNPFPTTIFIGHPTAKRLGARSGYMLINGIAILLMTSFGLIGWLLTWFPLTAIIPLLVYVGFDILVFGFSSDDHDGKRRPKLPRRHLIGVAVGLCPPLANLSVQAVSTAVSACGANLKTVFNNFAGAGYYLGGAISLTQGFLLTSMFWTATIVSWVDRKFFHAAFYMLCMGTFSWIGLVHAYKLSDLGDITNKFVGQKGVWIAAPGYTIAYGCIALFSLLVGLLFHLFHYEDEHTAELNAALRNEEGDSDEEDEILKEIVAERINETKPLLNALD